MKKAVTVFITFIMILSLAGCAGFASSKKAPVPSTLRLATGDSAGIYYSFGEAIAKGVSDNTDVDIVCISEEGSQDNVEALRDGAAEFAFCQADIMSYAKEGKRGFEEPVDNFSAVASLYTEMVQIVTLNENIKTVFDLKGKKVSIGAAGSGVYYNALDILEAFELEEADLEPSYKSFSESVDALKSGMIDAAFVVAGTPTTAITDLMESVGNVYFVSIDKNHMEKLLKLSPYYTKCVIPSDVYGTANDINVIGVDAVMLARNEVPENAVYSVCQYLFENADNLQDIHEKFDEINPDFATKITSVPYHSGAAKYFSEKGYSVAN